MIQLYAPYNYSTDEMSEATGLMCKDPSLADQSQKEECDINTIVNRFGVTGHLPENLALPRYAVLEEVGDFQTYMNREVDAQLAYNRMPAGLRNVVGKTYRDFLAFVDDPANQEKLIEHGLAVRRVEFDTSGSKSEDGKA